MLHFFSASLFTSINVSNIYIKYVINICNKKTFVVHMYLYT